MYAGMTFRRGSGRIVGVHQRIDRIARRNLNKFVKKSTNFPGIRSILRFEGKNGPDGLKLKHASTDVPWHFIDPSDPDDKGLLMIIDDHIYNLALALKQKDGIRAAFESAWLAHAITDGLTPAHHHRLGAKIEEIFGKSRKKLQGLADKTRIHGINRRDTIAKNWEYWGAGGVVVNHLKFELGVATAISSDSFKTIELTQADIDSMIEYGFETNFLKSVRNVHNFDIYNNFIRTGWTVDLVKTIKENLLPEMVKSVALAWYQAVLLSKELQI